MSRITPVVASTASSTAATSVATPSSPSVVKVKKSRDGLDYASFAVSFASLGLAALSLFLLNKKTSAPSGKLSSKSVKTSDGLSDATLDGDRMQFFYRGQSFIVPQSIADVSDQDGPVYSWAVMEMNIIDGSSPTVVIVGRREDAVAVGLKMKRLAPSKNLRQMVVKMDVTKMPIVAEWFADPPARDCQLL